VKGKETELETKPSGYVGGKGYYAIWCRVLS